MTPLGFIECGRAISATGRRNDHVAPLREPHRRVPELHERKEAAFFLVERNAMVHDHERERTLADGPDHIGDRGQRDRDRPDFLLDGLFSGTLVGESSRGKHREDGGGDDKNALQISKHRHASRVSLIPAVTG